MPAPPRSAPVPPAAAIAPAHPEAGELPPLVDVFLSYSRRDAALASRAAQTLRDEGFEVWFDRAIRAGAEWERTLRAVLASAKAVLVLWSEHAAASRWVRLEARIARDSQRLVHASIDGTLPPAGFRHLEAALLPGWDGGPDGGAELQVLLAGLAHRAPPSRIDTVRPGFDEHFLGVPVELPGVPGVADEFRYQHFSVVMNPARRLAWYSAANVARRDIEVPRGDAWLPDPTLPRAFQPLNEHYRGTGLDRGHLTRTRAVSWGPERLARIANRQAFFWTNTVPQHPLMNQRWWLAVEQWEDALLATHERLVVFSGPALRDDDPVHLAMEQRVGRVRTRENFRLPRAFWKLVVLRDPSDGVAAGALRSAAFWLDQDALLGGTRKVGTQATGTPAARRPGPGVGASNLDPSQWRVPVAEIEARTGLDFGDALRQCLSL